MIVLVSERSLELRFFFIGSFHPPVVQRSGEDALRRAGKFGATALRLLSNWMHLGWRLQASHAMQVEL